MIVIGDNTNVLNSLTVSDYTDFYTPFTVPYQSPLAYPTTDGNSPVSNTLAETYANNIFPCRIDRVIFHDPATVVYWKDGTKTVVKCHDEPFDREKGLAMCIAKKVLGKDFHKTFREWCE